VFVDFFSENLQGNMYEREEGGEGREDRYCGLNFIYLVHVSSDQKSLCSNLVPRDLS